MPELEHDTRARIAAFLPQAIGTALESYQTFTAHTPLDKASEFKAHHDACKVALAHIELLIKLARWAELPDPETVDEDQQKLLMHLIENAKGELGE